MPLMWRADAAPEYFWVEMEKIVAQGYVPDLIETWRDRYGRNINNWPLEYQAIDCLWGVKNDPNLVDDVFRGLPDEDDITADEAVDLAWQKLLEHKDQLAQPIVDQLVPRLSFLYNYCGDGRHTWIVYFGIGVDTDYAVFDIDAKTGSIKGYGIGPAQG